MHIDDEGSKQVASAMQLENVLTAIWCSGRLHHGGEWILLRARRFLPF
jgi:hypothetical protein